MKTLSKKDKILYIKYAITERYDNPALEHYLTFKCNQAGQKVVLFGGKLSMSELLECYV